MYEKSIGAIRLSNNANVKLLLYPGAKNNAHEYRYGNDYNSYNGYHHERYN